MLTLPPCDPARFPGAAGFDVRTSDLLKGELHDVTTPQGFLFALKGVVRVRYNGLLWLGVPCNRTLGSDYGFPITMPDSF